MAQAEHSFMDREPWAQDYKTALAIRRALEEAA
jgi:hypothetical protein